MMQVRHAGRRGKGIEERDLFDSAAPLATGEGATESSAKGYVR